MKETGVDAKHDGGGEGLSRLASAGLAIGAIGLVALLGRGSNPTPDHPRTRRWYKRLDKPAFTPPDAAFGIGWSLIETAQAAGGYRLLRHPSTPARNAALGLWALNQAAIAGWSAIFFGERRTGLGTAVAAGMAGTSAVQALTAARVDRKAAASTLPLVGWLCFATVLAEEVWRRNRSGSDPQAAA